MKFYIECHNRLAGQTGNNYDLFCIDVDSAMCSSCRTAVICSVAHIYIYLRVISLTAAFWTDCSHWRRMHQW